MPLHHLLSKAHTSSLLQLHLLPSFVTALCFIPVVQNDLQAGLKVLCSLIPVLLYHSPPHCFSSSCLPASSLVRGPQRLHRLPKPLLLGEELGGLPLCSSSSIDITLSCVYHFIMKLLVCLTASFI